MSLIDQLIEASTSNGKTKISELREMQREALDFDWYSKRDANVEKLEAFGSKVVKKVIDQVDIMNPIPLFFDVVQGNLDEELELQDVYGGRVYDYAYGTTMKISRLTTEAWTVLRTPRQLAFRETIQKIKTGRVLISDMVYNAARAIVVHKVKTAINTMIAAYPTTSSYVVNAGSADITAAKLDDAIRPVRGLAQIRAIVGDSRALYPISTFTGYDNSTGFSEQQKQELAQKGMLGMYKGIPIVELKDYTDLRYGNNPIAATNVWILPVDAKKKFNVFEEAGSINPEPPETNQETSEVSLYFRWEDGAALPSSSNKLRYARRIYGCATS